MKILKKSVLLIMGVAVWTLISCDSYLSGVDEIVVAELDRLGVQPTNFAKIKAFTIPENLDFNSEAGWGLTMQNCDRGGYDLSPYAGQTLTFTNVNIKGICDDRYPIRIWVASTDEAIACAYFTIREGSSAAPGSWPVNSPNCSIPDPATGCN